MRILFFSLLLISSLFSNTISEDRLNIISSFIKKENELLFLIERYIRDTGDLNPTRAEIQKNFDISSSIWTNFSKQACSKDSSGYCIGNGNDGIRLSFDISKRTIVLSNTLGNSYNKFSEEHYMKSSNSRRSVSNANSLSYVVDVKTLKIIEEIEEILSTPNAHFGTTAPSSNKTWYKMNEVGEIEAFSYKNGKWQKKGFSSDEGKIYAKSFSELNNYACTINDIGHVNTLTGTAKYICNSLGVWIKLKSDAVFHGSGTYTEMLFLHKDKALKSTVKAYSEENLYSGTRTFTKSKQGSFTYWIDEEKEIIISDNIKVYEILNIPTKKHFFLARSDIEGIHYLQEKVTPIASKALVFIAKDLYDLASNYKAINSYYGGYVFVKTKNKNYSRNRNVWTSTDNKDKISISGRNEFVYVNSNYNYYTKDNDCSQYDCNGDSSQNYYSLTKEENLYKFNYVTTGKRLNNLTDAIKVSSLVEAYDTGYKTVIINNKLYTKDTDINGNIIYKSNNEYFLKNGNKLFSEFINNKVNFPVGIDATNVTFYGRCINLNSRTSATKWIKAHDGVCVRVSNKNFYHRKYSVYDFWTDNKANDGQRYANEIFTKGTRSSFPYITKTIKALTKQLGSETRYTQNGLKSKIDNTFYEWHHSDSGTRVRNLVDGIIIEGSIVNPTTMRRFSDNKQYIKYLGGWYHTKSSGFPIGYFKYKVAITYNKNRGSCESTKIIYSSNNKTKFGIYTDNGWFHDSITKKKINNEQTTHVWTIYRSSCIGSVTATLLQIESN